MQQKQLFNDAQSFVLYNGVTVQVNRFDEQFVYFTYNGEQMQKTHSIFAMMTGDVCKHLFNAGVMR